MRVYFAPCGIGLGHVGRSVPIARELLKKDAQIMFSTYKDGIAYIEKEKFPLFEAPQIGVQVKPDGTIDFRQTAVNPGPFLSVYTLLKQVTAELRAMEGFDPDVIVSDSRASTLLAARFLRKPRVCILNQFQVIIPRKKRYLRLAKLADYGTLTIIGRIWTSGNTVLIPDFPPPYTIGTGNLNIPKIYRKTLNLIGPILSVRPNELPTKEELRKKLNLPEGKPVIFAPISGPINERVYLTETLQEILSDFPEEYEIVMSLGYPNAGNKVTKSGNVTIYNWLPNRFEYLKACDVAIGRSGHGTLTQSMCYGKPIILIPTPSHTEQLNNAKQAAHLGVAKIIQQEELSKRTLLDSVRKTLEDGTVERVEEIEKEVLKNDGLQNAVRIIMKVAEK